MGGTLRKGRYLHLDFLGPMAPEALVCNLQQLRAKSAFEHSSKQQVDYNNLVESNGGNSYCASVHTMFSSSGIRMAHFSDVQLQKGAQVRR